MTKDQTTGVAERVLYGIAMALFAKGVERGWYDAEMAGYLAGGFVSLIGGIYAWWINRPVALLNAAGNSIPENAKLVITAKPGATVAEKTTAIDLAGAANDKVTAKV